MKRIADADKLIALLEEAGYEAYYVGGCVRDPLLGANEPEESDPADIDVTTSATPEEMKEVFADFRYFETGIKHGTITVLTPDKKGLPVEITTFRTDGEYSDNRHPDEVRFVKNLEEDLARRDFTINAMAMDRRGNVVDYYGGMQDLEGGIIRAVGDPDRRFQEDALRILRALRFAAVLTRRDISGEEKGFRIEPETEAAMFRNKERLRSISVERIYAELKKLIVGPRAGIVVRRYVDIIGVFLPELLPIKGFEQHNPYHKYDVLEHCIRAMEAVRPVTDMAAGEDDFATEYQIKLAALLHDVGKPQTFFLDEDGIGHMYGHAKAGEKIVREIMNRMKADNESKERICKLVEYHDLVFQNDRRILRKWMNRYTPQLLLDVLHIKRADNFATGNMSRELAEKFDEIEKTIYAILDEAQCFSLKDLAIDGRDIIAIGQGTTGGRWIGETLQTLLDEVIDGKLPNEKEALSARAAELLEKLDSSD